MYRIIVPPQTWQRAVLYRKEWGCSANEPLESLLEIKVGDTICFGNSLVDDFETLTASDIPNITHNPDTLSSTIRFQSCLVTIEVYVE